METWWRRYPDAFEAEKAALNALGYPWMIDQAAFDAGRLLIVVEVPDRAGGKLRLTAEFPATYPYFPPYVSLDEIVFSRHQHPVGKNLCLLAREAEDWEPERDTLAILIRDQLPLIQDINTGAAADSVAEREDHVGEPLSTFLSYQANSVIIVPDDEPPKAHTAGRLVVRYRPLPPSERTSGFLTGGISSVMDLKREVLCGLTAIPPSFSLTIDGYWMRLPARPELTDERTLHLDLYRRMRTTVPAFENAIKNGRRGLMLVAGFLYDDEMQWRQSRHDWIFLLVRIDREAKRGKDAHCTLFPIRTDWGGEQAWMHRAPDLLPLRKKSAVLFGLGSLGSPVAVHFARAGLHKLTMIDGDHLQVGNTIRWALGWQYAGLDKTLALTSYITQEYPYTEVHGYKFQIGMPIRPHGEFFSDYDFIVKQITDADIVVDASANHRVSHFLSDLARELGKPYVWLTTTHGCAGGIVGRQLPGKSHGCWHCFMHGLADKTIALPAEANTEKIQPGGCSQATFIGAGIDSDEIALLGARLAIATLCREGGYPDFDWNAAVCNLQHGGVAIAPVWSAYPLHPHRACTACSHI